MLGELVLPQALEVRMVLGWGGVGLYYRLSKKKKEKKNVDSLCRILSDFDFINLGQ